jgi:dGTPase
MEKAVKAFLFANMYRHPKVMGVRRQAATVVQDLFARFTSDPSCLPEEWKEGLLRLDEAHLARRVADYIAGMTDTFALSEHRRLFDSTPDMR